MLRWLMTSAHSPKAGAYSLCGSSSTMWAAGLLLQDRAQDQRRRAGLAGAGGAQDGEMLAEQIVDADGGRDRRVLADAADAHGVAPVAAEGLLQLLARGDAHPVAQRRVDRHAAIEGGRPAVRPASTARRRGRARRSTARSRLRAGPGPARSAPRRWPAPPYWSSRSRTACPSRAAAGPGRAFLACAMPSSSSTMALAPVTDTMRPMERSGCSGAAAGCGCYGDIIVGSSVCPRERHVAGIARASAVDACPTPRSPRGQH